MYGKDAVTTRTCQKWFKKFRSGNLSLEDSSRSGRPTEIDADKIKQLQIENPHLTTRDIAGVLQVSHTSVLRHIRKTDPNKK